MKGISPSLCLAFIAAIDVSDVTLLDLCSFDGQHGLENGSLPAADMRLRLACSSPAICKVAVDRSAEVAKWLTACLSSAAGPVG